MIPGSANPLLLASAAEAGAYQIERSLRFNSADSAYLSRTPASAGNRRTYTYSAWVKRAALGAGTYYLFTAVDGSNVDIIGFEADRFYWYNAFSGAVNSQALYRDPSAWYHVLASVDSTQATSTDRVKLYVNGAEIAYSSDLYPSLNRDFAVNNTVAHKVGQYFTTNSSNFYLADIHFIDGQALDPSSFGEFDTNGVWQPKAYAGSYGTNGFHLPFSDNSTAAALGTDTSGNGNTWTVNNISVTAGAGNDSLVDSPTNYGTDTGAGGEVRGNYATWNAVNKSNNDTLSNGNLDIVSSVSQGQTLATIGVTSGKWYWEVTKSTSNNPNSAGLGFMQQEYKTSSTFVGSGAGRNFIYLQSGFVYLYDESTNYFFSSPSLVNNTGTWMFALDLDDQKMWFGKDGVWYDKTGSIITGPSSGLNAPFTNFNSSSGYFPFYNSDSAAITYVANFGQRPFAYTAPSGFKALCTTNLPTPTIADGSTAMDVALYTGNGSTQTISGLNFSPDFVWVKARNAAYSHRLWDVVRGATKGLLSDGTDAEFTEVNGLTSFNSDGFSVGTGLSEATKTYVAWTWDAGSSTVANDAGSITSQVRANASAGFSVVTYTSTTGSFTVGHGLNAPPAFIVNKDRDNANNWLVYHSALGGTKGLSINLADSAYTDSGYWNNTDPTSSVFTTGAYHAFSGAAARVAYCFAPVAGYSAFGSYTGNGLADGPFVYTGFRPRWILLKSSTEGVSWVVYDTARNAYNLVNSTLSPDLSSPESAPGVSGGIDILSNGFKLRSNDQWLNFNAANYIYAAFAEHPFATSRAR